jgi:hypothetical protein
LGLVAVGLPLGQMTWDGSKFLSPASFAPGTVEMYGGKFTVILVHTLTALIGAPLLAEAGLLMIILISSIAWLLLIWLLSAFHVAAKFIMLRITEHEDGPVLGVSAMLVAVGGFIKACAW